MAALQATQSTVWSQVITKITGSAEEGMAFATLPLPALYTFMMAMLFVPLLAVLLTSDLVADDLRTGHIRYLSLRCGRSSLLFGRLLSRALLLGTTVLGGTAISFSIFLAKQRDLAPDAYVHFLRYGLLLVVISLTSAALAAFCSTLVRSAFFALVLGIFGTLLLGVVSIASEWLTYATPGHYLPLLISPLRWPMGLAAFTGFAVLFSAAAWLRLRTRDL